MTLSLINGYINPFSQEFEAAVEDFLYLEFDEKTLTLFLTIIAGIGTIFVGGIGGVATFRAMVNYYNPTVQKTDEVRANSTLSSQPSASNNASKTNPLWKAVEEGDLEKVKFFCKHNKKWTNLARPDGTTALHLASKAGHIEIVQVLIEAGADTKRLVNNESALFYACEHKHYELAKILAKTMADKGRLKPNEINQIELYPQIAGYLIAKGAQPKGYGGFCVGLTFLYGYYQFLGEKNEFFKQIRKVKLFNIDHSNDLSNKSYVQLSEDEKGLEHFVNDVLYLQQGRSQVNPLKAMHFVSDKEEIKKLSSQFQYASYFPCDSNTGKYITFQATLQKILEQDPAKAKFLYIRNSHGIGIFYKDGKFEFYDSSLSEELPAFICNKENISTLVNDRLHHYLARRSGVVTINVIANEDLPGLKAIQGELLFDINPGIELGPDVYINPLHLASYDGYIESALTILEKGADIDSVCGSQKVTALMCAVFNGHLEIVERLIEKNANLDLATSDRGATALMVAIGQGHLDCAKMLIEKGANLDKIQIDGCSALQSILEAKVFSRDHLKIAKLLIERGANTDKALAIAEGKGYIEIVEMISQGSKSENGKATIQDAND